MIFPNQLPLMTKTQARLWVNRDKPNVWYWVTTKKFKDTFSTLIETSQLPLWKVWVVDNLLLDQFYLLFSYLYQSPGPWGKALFKHTNAFSLCQQSMLGEYVFNQ